MLGADQPPVCQSRHLHCELCTTAIEGLSRSFTGCLECGKIVCKECQNQHERNHADAGLFRGLRRQKAYRLDRYKHDISKPEAYPMGRLPAGSTAEPEQEQEGAGSAAWEGPLRAGARLAQTESSDEEGYAQEDKCSGCGSRYCLLPAAECRAQKKRLVLNHVIGALGRIDDPELLLRDLIGPGDILSCLRNEFNAQSNFVEKRAQQKFVAQQQRAAPRRAACEAEEFWAELTKLAKKGREETSGSPGASPEAGAVIAKPQGTMEHWRIAIVESIQEGLERARYLKGTRWK